eukprot:TRINITY_DN12767_c0_g1_i1.p1 TRINITY_DN12767_c0_g1~~TRINITY_DN12767_c0_g1_i1.p1  ORF type:complete len:122 (+),score=32.11 TRINITY_DN12767_c0_g1_i1:33-398(+)
MDTKKFQIKVDVCHRILKDWKYYQKDQTREEQQLASLREQSSEDNKYQLRQMEEVLRETMAMVQDAKNRMNNAFQDLQQAMDLMRGSEGFDSFQETEVWVNANDFVSFFEDEEKVKAYLQE